MTRLVLGGALLLCLAAPAPAQQDPPSPIGLLPGVLAGYGGQDMDPSELEKAIGQAIDKGVAWLKKQQKSEGHFGESSGPVYGGVGQAYHNKPGNCALSLLALLKSDVDPADPVITKGFKWLYGYMLQKGEKRSTYDSGVTLMAIEALYEATLAAKMKKDGKQVTERAGDFKEPKYAISGSDAKVVSDIVKYLDNNQTKKGGWRYGDGFQIVGSDEDISATQIVLLGLKSATRMRVPVNPKIFERAMTFILDAQEKDGPKVERPSDGSFRAGDRGTYASNGEDKARGWAYEAKSDNKQETTVTGSMTCAGITELLICKSVIGKALSKTLNEKIEQCIYDGFAWIYTHWDLTKNPGGGRSHYYYLYGIERIGTLGCYERIGKHMWFKQGAQFLVRAQRADGSWTDNEVEPRDLYATCFALLFLRRGTVPIGDVMTGPRKQ